MDDGQNGKTMRINWIYIDILVGGFNPYEKYESQLGLLFPIRGKIKKCSKPPTSI
jgi:hypothetical protein